MACSRSWPEASIDREERAKGRTNLERVPGSPSGPCQGQASVSLYKAAHIFHHLWNSVFNSSGLKFLHWQKTKTKMEALRMKRRQMERI